MAQDNPLMEPEAFQAWKDSPLTRGYLAALRQRQTDLMAAWGRGQAMSVENQAAAVLLGQLADLSHEDFMAEFFGVEVSDA